MTDILQNAIAEFEPTDLVGLGRAALMKRVDTKFIMPLSKLATLLRMIKDEYQILEIDGVRANEYETLYFDTPNFLFFNEHLRGRPERIKVRKRKYVGSALTFLEVKGKNRKGETKKQRIQIPNLSEDINELENAFIREKTGQEFHLNPAVRNRFSRLTLLNKQEEERATIDFNLTFTYDKKSFESPQLVIVELKQKHFERRSPLYQALRSLEIRPLRISKYCFGTSKLNGALKHNMYKHKILKINKIAS